MHSEAIFFACWRTVASEEEPKRPELEEYELEDDPNTGGTGTLFEEDSGSGPGVGGTGSETGSSSEEDGFFVFLSDEVFSTAAALEEFVPELEDFSSEEELTEDFFDDDERVDLLLEDFSFCDEELDEFTEDKVSVLDNNSS